MSIFPDDNVVMVLQTNVVSDWPAAGRMLETVALRVFDGEAYPDVPDLVSEIYRKQDRSNA